MEPWRTSPATKRPGWLGSRKSGARASGHAGCSMREHTVRGRHRDPCLLADRPEPRPRARLGDAAGLDPRHRQTTATLSSDESLISRLRRSCRARPFALLNHPPVATGRRPSSVVVSGGCRGPVSFRRAHRSAGCSSPRPGFSCSSARARAGGTRSGAGSISCSSSSFLGPRRMHGGASRPSRSRRCETPPLVSFEGLLAAGAPSSGPCMRRAIRSPRRRSRRPRKSPTAVSSCARQSRR